MRTKLAEHTFVVVGSEHVKHTHPANVNKPTPPKSMKLTLTTYVYTKGMSVSQLPPKVASTLTLAMVLLDGHPIHDAIGRTPTHPTIRNTP